MSSKTMVVQVHSFDVSYNPCKYKMPAFILKDSNSSKIESIIKEFRDDSNNEIKEVNTVVE
jgi:predicted N-formylglutamate amidohydrolase